MKRLPQLFENNRAWAAQITAADPVFFQKLARQQSPDFLWIGCSDSRVPANEIVGLLPGELFVHRNVANLVVDSDLNCLAVIQYAVEVLKVRHIMVCGHYGCGGVKAAMGGCPPGPVDEWLQHVRDIRRRWAGVLETLGDGEPRVNRLCELNVMEQVVNAGRTAPVQAAWGKGQALTVHGWIYGISNGFLKDLEVCVSTGAELRGLEARLQAGR